MRVRGEMGVLGRREEEEERGRLLNCNPAPLLVLVKREEAISELPKEALDSDPLVGGVLVDQDERSRSSTSRGRGRRREDARDELAVKLAYDTGGSEGRFAELRGGESVR